MTRSPLTHILRASPVAAAMIVFTAAPLLAQGTAAEREACTPDALKLCSDTIPDIPKTTACMKAHEAELSPRCHAVFASRAERTARRRSSVSSRRVEREERDERVGRAERVEREAPPRDYDEAPGERRYLYREPDGREAEASERGPGPDPWERARARDEIGRLCDEEMIDPRTCALADRALR